MTDVKSLRESDQSSSICNSAAGGRWLVYRDANFDHVEKVS